MHKLALIVGHNSARKGAVSPHLSIAEFSYWSTWAQSFAVAHDPEDTGWEVKVFHRSPDIGYGAQIEKVYALADEWGADATIELHFNSADAASAYGCEMLSSGSRHSMALAAELQQETLNFCYEDDQRKSLNRGVKVVMEGERGHMSLHTSRAPSVLVEPFFGSNRRDCEKWDGANFAAALTQAVTHSFRNHFPSKSLDDSRTMKATKRQRQFSAGGVITAVSAAATVVVDSLGEPETAVEAAQAASRITDLMPWLGSGFILAAGVAFMIVRWQADKIEAAREDDHERGLR